MSSNNKTAAWLIAPNAPSVTEPSNPNNSHNAIGGSWMTANKEAIIRAAG
ncbi:hypothetical protein N0M98_00725 [Paenibacillus doosanensis]|nr:hypothetical protein [Paenibacillus doosanensis]MCS7458646.1 hypothetical protein [Paenibacillus doosanensis]